MGPVGGSGGCLAFAGASAKRKTVRLRRSGSGGAGVKAAGGDAAAARLASIVTGLKVMRSGGLGLHGTVGAGRLLPFFSDHVAV